VLNALKAMLQDCATHCDCVSSHLIKPDAGTKDKIVVRAWLSAVLGNAYGNVFSAEKNLDHQLLNYDHAAFAPIAFVETLLAEIEAGDIES
jgi:hypothetical protein